MPKFPVVPGKPPPRLPASAAPVLALRNAMPPAQSVGQLPFGIPVPDRSMVETSSAAPEPWPRFTRPQAPSMYASSQRSTKLFVIEGVAKLTVFDGFDFISVSMRAPTRRPGVAWPEALIPKRVLLGCASTLNHLLLKPSSTNIMARLTWPYSCTLIPGCAPVTPDGACACTALPASNSAPPTAAATCVLRSFIEPPIL